MVFNFLSSLFISWNILKFSFFEVHRANCVSLRLQSKFNVSSFKKSTIVFHCFLFINKDSLKFFSRDYLSILFNLFLDLYRSL